jgi:hypothetical protein
MPKTHKTVKVEETGRTFEVKSGDEVIRVEIKDGFLHILPEKGQAFIFQSLNNELTIKRWRAVNKLIGAALDELEIALPTSN